MSTTHEKTQKILDAFQKVCAIPRCSKNEARIAQFLLDWAAQHNLRSKKDKAGNVVIEVPATPGYEAATGAVIQGHLDMVCEKTPESTHDFCKDAIQTVVDGEWLRAKDTTLGADNGIAIAMAMVVALDPDVPHPALELLFTVDEEQGLKGANELQPGFIKGKYLLNVDSEDEGVFTVGCAGGRDTHIAAPYRRKTLDPIYRPFTLKASGMTGGHSGVNINEERANAIIILARALAQIKRKYPLLIESISGGTAHNAIPRDAEAVFYLPAKVREWAAGVAAEVEKDCRAEYRNTDPGLKLTFSPFAGKPQKRAASPEHSGRLIDLLLALPHGIAAMSTDMKGLVETSNNLASIRTEEKCWQIVTSQRSSVMTRLHALTHRIETIAALAGAEAKSGKGYPSWQPNLQSPLLARFQSVYRQLFGKEAHVEAIHAGLECGIIGDKYAGMDMISFGPTLKNPHSPAEKLHIPSIGKVWDLLAAVLKSLK